MKIAFTRALLGVVTACALQSAPAFAQQSSIVSIEGCAAGAGSPALHFTSAFGTPVDQPAVPGMLMIAFKAGKPLSSIDFGVVHDGKVVGVVRDVGTFSPGAVVMHAYMLPSGVESEESVSCVPLAAKYADGSSWMNSAMPPR